MSGILSRTASGTPKGSDRLSAAHLSLAQIYALDGRARDATKFLSNAERLLARNSDATWRRSFLAIKGVILIALCEYRQALSVLPRYAVGDHQARVLNNRAVCMEHLGQLDAACAYQSEALDVSRHQGVLEAELQSLANMGAFETKRGKFEIAAASFRGAESFCASMNLYREGDRRNLPLLAAEHAALRMEMGQYAEARKLFVSAFRWLKRDRTSQSAIWAALKRSEFYTRTGEMELAAPVIDSVSASELFDTDFLKVERALIEAILLRFPEIDRLRLLDDALPLTASLGTLYQRCRVLIESAALLIDTERDEEARTRVAEALRLARRHGYRPLEASALLIKGSVTRKKRVRHECLLQAYRIASDTPLPEIAAESALRIGEHQLELNDLFNAREYLSRSVSLTKSLAGGLPARARNRYLRVPWRRQAMKLLASVENQLPAPGRPTPIKDPQDRPLFKVAYETTMSLGAAKGVEEYVRALNGGNQTGAQVRRRVHANRPRQDRVSLSGSPA